MSSRRDESRCEERARLWQFAEGRLAAEGREQVQAHLDGCATCRQELVAMQATRTLLSEAGERHPAEGPSPLEDSAPPAAKRTVRGFPALKPGPALALAAGIAACLVALQATDTPVAKPPLQTRRAPRSLEEEVVRAPAPDLAQASAPQPGPPPPSVGQGPAAPLPPAEAAPAAPAPVQAPASAPARRDDAVPAAGELAAAERLYLQRAEEARSRGECERTLGPLEGFAAGGVSKSARETARILRARCLRQLGRGLEADAEYRLYLQEHPGGAFSGEARSVVAH